MFSFTHTSDEPICLRRNEQNIESVVMEKQQWIIFVLSTYTVAVNSTKNAKNVKRLSFLSDFEQTQISPTIKVPNTPISEFNL